MKCPSCAANYDDVFSSCPYCGTTRPQEPAARIRMQERKYETCEITRQSVDIGRLFTNLAFVYIADALGPKGTYRVDMTPPIRSEPEERPAIQALVQRLLEKGWDPDGRGSYYYSYRFRRSTE